MSTKYFSRQNLYSITSVALQRFSASHHIFGGYNRIKYILLVHKSVPNCSMAYNWSREPTIWLKTNSVLLAQLHYCTNINFLETDTILCSQKNGHVILRFSPPQSVFSFRIKE